MSISKIIKNTYIDTELVLPTYNAHPYSSLKTSGKKCALQVAKYSNTKKGSNIKEEWNEDIKYIDWQMNCTYYQ